MKVLQRSTKEFEYAGCISLLLTEPQVRYKQILQWIDENEIRLVPMRLDYYQAL